MELVAGGVAHRRDRAKGEWPFLNSPPEPALIGDPHHILSLGSGLTAAACVAAIEF